MPTKKPITIQICPLTSLKIQLANLVIRISDEIILVKRLRLSDLFEPFHCDPIALISAHHLTQAVYVGGLVSVTNKWNIKATSRIHDTSTSRPDTRMPPIPSTDVHVATDP